MIVVNKINSGKMGNKLFQYNFLKQLVGKTDLKFIHPKFPESKYFLDMRRHKGKFNIFFKKKIKYSQKKIIHLGQNSFLEELCYNDSKEILSIIEPPILGELFFDYLFIDPNELIKIKSKYQLNQRRQSLNVKISLHFRGGDFARWEPRAVLPTKYYLDAIEMCRKEFNKKIDWHLFTDDKSLESFNLVSNHLKSSNIFFGSPDAEPIFDFIALMNSDVIISSPSTYAIWAGILGKRKKIIHSKKWLSYAIQQKSKFWIDTINYRSKYYNIWRQI